MDGVAIKNKTTQINSFKISLNTIIKCIIVPLSGQVNSPASQIRITSHYIQS